MKDKKQLLRQETWGKKQSYYDSTTIAYRNIQSHIGYRLMLPYLSKVYTICEFGCGNGSVIGNIVKLHSTIKAFGVDFSELAIKQAKKLYKGKLHFYVGNAESFSFPQQADITLSFYTFEHLDAPEKVFANMVKQTKTGGYVVIVCPNYGSPIYPSPCYTKGWLQRLNHALRRDINLMSSKGEKKLLWEHVDPIIDAGTVHVMDHDTTIEPYSYSLKKFIEGKYPNLSIEVLTSGWHTVQTKNVSKRYWFATLPLRTAAFLKISPFVHWGPVLMLVAKKS